jgi:nicotinate-nucleotide adenylyltransferase
MAAKLGTGARLGVFGGTFDPPHIGHLILAAEARVHLELERVLWVLTPAPPHKRDIPITPVERRLEMLSVCLANNPDFEISRVELDRSGPHYAVDTLNLLQAEYPHTHLVYLMGGDSLRDLPGWHAAPEFLHACGSLGVLRRPQAEPDWSELEKELPGLAAKVEWIDIPELGISSSLIRAKIASREHYRYYLHPDVYRIIQSGGWYQGPPDPAQGILR